MIRRPPRSTLDRSSAASDVYKRQETSGADYNSEIGMLTWRMNLKNGETKKFRVAYTAVSYTHLRAHETVLDLVCRLLLEKKNKQLHNNHLHYLVKAKHHARTTQT